MRPVKILLHLGSTRVSEISAVAINPLLRKRYKGNRKDTLKLCSDQTRRKYSIASTGASNANKNNREPHQYEPETTRFLCDLSALSSGSEGR